MFKLSIQLSFLCVSYDGYDRKTVKDHYGIRVNKCFKLKFYGYVLQGKGGFLTVYCKPPARPQHWGFLNEMYFKMFSKL